MRCTAVWVLVCLLLFSGCDSRPSDVLSRDKMADVLFDVHKADATIDVSAPYKGVADKQEYYNSVFRKWGVTKEEFDRSLDWYAEHPDLLLAIYDTLRSRADDLQNRVEAYEYHPDDKPTYFDSIDDFDLWKWQRVQMLENRGSRVIAADSLRFEINDSNYFARSNELIFDLEMRARSLDSATYRTYLVFQYADSTLDTLSHTSLADTLTRRYHYYKLLPDTVALSRLEIVFVDEPFWLSKVEVKSVSLVRRYHRYDSPILPRVRSEVRASRDSVRMAQKRR